MLSLFLFMSVAAGDATPVFAQARPVWPRGRELDMNVTAGFRAVIDAPASGPVHLRIAAATMYRAFVNGVFLAHGPARGPHGWFRVDDWDIAPLLRPGPNVVAIEVAGCNVNSYYVIDQPSFLQAEIVAGDTVLAATGDAARPFSGRVLADRLQKTGRYSFQRAFTEVYRLQPGCDTWRKDPAAAFTPEPCPPLEARQLLPRRVPCPDFAVRPALRVVSAGAMAARPGEFHPRKGNYMTRVGPEIKGFPEAELEATPELDLQRFETRLEPRDEPLTPETVLDLAANECRILDMGVNLTGFIGARIGCTQNTRVCFTFDEILSQKGDVDFLRMGCSNVITFDLAPGDYEVESFEPYTFRYLKPIVVGGAARIQGVHVREYANPDTRAARFAAPDPRLERLFAAGIETFRQNAVDLFMDCPSRERAGWLCDSFFAARVAHDLSGGTAVEKAFLENYLLPPVFDRLPPGMLPMCYPADHYNGIFIPNWALWFVVQLEEYLGRSGDRAMVEAFQPKIEALFGYFKRLENSDGLLEKLESWVFIEWSEANEFTQDVNYPSNMLYAGALDAAGRVYARADWREKAARLRETIRRQAFDGDFFADNALRKDGALEVTRNRTEVCQYFAFYFGVATPESCPGLWSKLRDEFGSRRKETNAYPEVHPANAFVGNTLRLELLSRYGNVRQALSESVDYLLYMAEQTGTLWENVDSRASCNHGFASHIVHVLFRDAVGIEAIDTNRKTVYIRFAEAGLPWCEGSVPTPDGPVRLKWRHQDGGAIAYQCAVPVGYEVRVENLTGRALQREDAPAA